jgi:hypothetical protein
VQWQRRGKHLRQNSRWDLKPKMTVMARTAARTDWAGVSVLVRPLLSSKRRPHFKTRKILKRTEIWSWLQIPRFTVLARPRSNLNWPRDRPSRNFEPSESKTWSWVPWCLEPRLTVLARPRSNLAFSQPTQGFHDAQGRETLKHGHESRRTRY